MTAAQRVARFQPWEQLEALARLDRAALAERFPSVDPDELAAAILELLQGQGEAWR